VPTKPLYKKLVIAGVLLVVFLLMKVTRTSFEDLWYMAKGEIAQTRNDIREFRTGEYAGNISNQLSSEAARIKSQGGSGIDGDLNNELAAERKRMLEERAEVARQNTDRLLKGDTEVLKRNVRDNAQKAGGAN
jgi:hypothetical protein